MYTNINLNNVIDTATHVPAASKVKKVMSKFAFLNHNFGQNFLNETFSDSQKFMEGVSE